MEPASRGADQPRLEPALPLRLGYGGLYSDSKNRLWELYSKEDGVRQSWEAHAAAAASHDTGSSRWVRVTTGSRPLDAEELAKEIEADELERLEQERADREFEEEMADADREFEEEMAEMARKES